MLTFFKNEITRVKLKVTFIMTPFRIHPDAQSLVDQTLARAAKRQFFGWVRNSQAEAVTEIHEVFSIAASIKEIASGSPQNEKVLDLDEARLAVAALNLAVLTSGDRVERLIAANEAKEAKQELKKVVLQIKESSVRGESLANELLDHAVQRARGGSGHRNRKAITFAAQKQIWELFNMPVVLKLDPRPGLNVVDAVFASLALNFRSSNDVLWGHAFAAQRGATAALKSLVEIEVPQQKLVIK